jgi:predicted nucleic acid-binding protein
LVVDTNIVLYHLEGRQPVVELLDRLERLGEPLRISVVTRIEVLGHPRVHGVVEAEVRRFLSRFAVVGLTESLVERTIVVRRAGRLKLPDAVIAATALESGETLLTHDRRGFSSVPGLRLLDPFPVVPGSGPSTAGEKRVPYRPASPVRGRGRGRGRASTSSGRLIDAPSGRGGLLGPFGPSSASPTTDLPRGRIRSPLT